MKMIPNHRMAGANKYFQTEESQMFSTKMVVVYSQESKLARVQMKYFDLLVFDSKNQYIATWIIALSRTLPSLKLAKILQESIKYPQIT